MSKTIRLIDDVYSALKALSKEQGKTLSETVYALMQQQMTAPPLKNGSHPWNYKSKNSNHFFSKIKIRKAP